MPICLACDGLGRAGGTGRADRRDTRLGISRMGAQVVGLDARRVERRGSCGDGGDSCTTGPGVTLEGQAVTTGLTAGHALAACLASDPPAVLRLVHELRAVVTGVLRLVPTATVPPRDAPPGLLATGKSEDRVL